MSTTISPYIFINKAWKDGNDGITSEQYTEVVLLLNSMKKWEWIREIRFKNGYAFTRNECFNNIIKNIDTSNHTGHSITYMFKKIRETADELITRNIQECSICLLEDSGKFLMLECGHKFHEECITDKGIKLCPLCRQDTVPKFLC